MQSPRIDWLDQFAFEKVLRHSRQVGKPALLDLHDPTCAGCQQLELVTYSDPSVIAAIGEHVVPVRVVTQEPDSASRAIINRYISISTPTVQLLSPEGTIYHWWRGAPRHTRPARGYHGVYHEAIGDLSPARFLAQMSIGLGKVALTHGRFAEAAQLFKEVLTDYQGDHVTTAEAQYWQRIAVAKGSRYAGALEFV